jgi:uridine kinase
MLVLPAQAFLNIERIHGTSPLMLAALGDPDKMCPVCVSAVTAVSIDANHRFPTTSLRILRRIVRNCHFRGQFPRKTVRRWGSVRRCEEINISLRS